VPVWDEHAAEIAKNATGNTAMIERFIMLT
jgi:hypothetical protein